MKNECLMDYHFGKVAWTAQGVGLACLLIVLLLFAGCGGSSATGSSQTPASAPTSTPTSQASPTAFSKLTLSQAQQQAGYHLLSIPSSLTGYTLTKVVAVDFSGHRVYTLYYSMGKNPITLTEGQQMENTAGTKVSLRGTTGILFTINGHTFLSWTENGVNRSIIGMISSAQAITLAKALV
jgi:hypothetical protein